MTSTAVRVALRVRPLTEKEHLSNCTECISFIPNEPQILIGKDHSFTYDYIFDTRSPQQSIYEKSIVPLTEKFVEGFNATILAYGQTGSGKTFSMGTALDENLDSEQQGIVPRFIYDLFKRLESKKASSSEYNYQVFVTFLELYNEDLVDLLNIQHFSNGRKRTNSANVSSCEVQIREDIHGGIYWSGVREEPCSSPDELLRYLAKGSLCRTTGSTDMNSVSSRSHAIFSVIIKQQMPEEDQTVPGSESKQNVISKFHFVDLAGSERLKRTNAQGDRAREGISINSGLLALGNVISALGDDSRKSSHVPYRDSKLTRLLQDSLGGNSQTLMMACVSPSDSNFVETLSTLKYANRARNIKNKVTINQEFAGSSVEVNQLRSQVARLKMELNLLRSSGKTSDLMMSMLNNGTDNGTKAYQEEIYRLKSKISSMSDEICQITTERDTLRMERELTEHMTSVDWSQYQTTDVEMGEATALKSLPIIGQYQKQIRDLRNELTDTQERLAFCESMRAPLMHAMTMANKSMTPSASFITNHRSVSPAQKHANGRKRGVGKKRRTINGSTTTSRNITFRSTRRSKVPNAGPKKPMMMSNDSEDIEKWLQETVGNFNASESSGLRVEAKSSIENAKSQIDKALKVLDDFKNKEFEHDQVEYKCDLLADDELFDKLKSEENMSIFGDIEDASSNSDEQSQVQEPSSRPPRSRMTSVETNFSSLMDDSELEEYCEKNPQLHRVLTQIQSDIQVNEDLVGQLERTEIEYGQMRKKFEKKLYSLREEILTLRQQQKEATTKHTSLAQSKDAVVAHREKLHMNDVRHAYEAKMKTLMSQLSDLRRKYTATSSTIQSSRNQNESMLRALRVSVESLKDEKRRMVRKMKNEAERVKEQMHHHEREIQQLRRRQMKDAETKRRLEREGKQLNLILQKKTDESVITGEKLKRLIQILKKAVREGGVLDEKSLASCGSILDVGNALVQYSHVNRLSRKRKAPKKNRIPLQERTAKKKQLLDQALAQFIQGKQAVEEMKQLLSKRNALAQKKAEYLSEREMLLIDQDRQSYTIDRAITQAIDDNIETVEAEISYLNARIQSIHNDAANEIMQEDEADPVVDMSSRPEKRVTFADKMPNEKKDPENEWLDMDALEESYSISPNASPERCIDTIEKLLKSITADESSLIMENMVDDILLLRIEDYNSKMTFQQLEKTAQDLRCTLFVMKKAAIETTVENEKKIKRLQGSRRTSLSNLSLKSGNLQSSIHTEDGSDSDSAIDLYPEEQYQHIENMFDKIYNDGINGNILNSSWSEYHISRPTSPTIDVAPSPKLRPQIPQALSGKLGVNAPMKPSTSPLANRRNSNSSPEQFLQQFPQSFGGKLGTTAPMKPSISPLVHRRNSMSSPEQFLQQLLQTPKDVRPPPSPRMKPAEFARYQADRESSTSSIRSRNPRRTSIQSDSGSLPSIYPGNQSHKMTRASSGSKLPSNTDMSGVASNTNPPTAILNRRRAFSFQQPPSPTPTNMRRRSLLREMSYGYEEPKSPQKQQFQDLRDGSAARDYTNGTSLIPAFNNMGLASRPSSVLTLPTQPKLAKALPLRRDSSPSCSYELRRSSVNNVFDRLSSGHTQASQAKAKSNNYRYSTSNIEDLKRQWNSNEMEDEYAM